MDKCKFQAQIGDIIAISVEKIYNNSAVVEKEVAGFKVIHDLLKVCLQAVLNEEDTSYKSLIFRMITPLESISKAATTYTKILNTCSYISSLSDGEAIELQKKLSGLII